MNVVYNLKREETMDRCNECFTKLTEALGFSRKLDTLSKSTPEYDVASKEFNRCMSEAFEMMTHRDDVKRINCKLCVHRKSKAIKSAVHGGRIGTDYFCRLGVEKAFYAESGCASFLKITKNSERGK